jgi:hypothetical protein
LNNKWNKEKSFLKNIFSSPSTILPQNYDRPERKVTKFFVTLLTFFSGTGGSTFQQCFSDQSEDGGMRVDMYVHHPYSEMRFTVLNLSLYHPM